MTKSAMFRVSGWCLSALCAIGILVGAQPALADLVCPIVVLPTDGFSATGARAPRPSTLYSRSVYLITASELASSGLASGTVPAGIGFRFAVATGVAATGSLRVYLQNTTDTTNNKSANWTTAVSGMTLVHNDTTTIPDGDYAFEIPFSGSGISSFTYTGGGLYVAFDWSWPGPTVSQGLVAVTTSLPGGIRTATSNVGPPATLNAPTNNRPETWLTPSVTAPVSVNDAGVDHVISMGSISKSLVSPQAFQAVIINPGTHAQTNLPVALSVTGAQPFSDVQIVSVPRCGGITSVTFAPFTPTVTGSNTIAVSIPADDNAGNNTLSKSFDVTDDQYSYLHPGSVPDGPVETFQSTLLVAKFPITAAAKVSQIHLYFMAAGGTYRAVVYADSGSGTPASTPIYEDATDRSVDAAGPVTITLPAPVDVGPGNFYAGFLQTSNDETLQIGSDVEHPVRPNTFFAWFPGFQTWLPIGGPQTNNSINLTLGVTVVQCTTAADCDDGNSCTDDACNHSACVHTNNTASCDDGNPCTQTDTCQSGTCVGSNPVTCSALDQCHDAGTCNTTTGACSNPAKSDGTVCNDGSACTQTDTCQAGACVGSNPVTCTAADQCHDAGTCNLATGACSNPARADGTSCNDGNACTQTDSCQAGTCVGSNPVACTASDQCHVAGTCNPATGVCSNPNAANGTACNDGNACTQTDTCQAGACVGSNPVTCTASDQCHVAGTCNPANGVCSNPNAANGTACSDGNACTQTDSCQAGTCVGGNYSWSGFLQPVNADGSSVFKRGSTIPVKFRLTGACGGNSGLVANIYFYKISDTNGPVNEAVSTSAADTGTTFRYSASDDQYIYNLGTSGADITDGTWNLGVDLHDGVGIRSVTVGLRK